MTDLEQTGELDKLPIGTNVIVVDGSKFNRCFATIIFVGETAYKLSVKLKGTTQIHYTPFDGVEFWSPGLL